MEPVTRTKNLKMTESATFFGTKIFRDFFSTKFRILFLIQKNTEKFWNFDVMHYEVPEQNKNFSY